MRLDRTRLWYAEKNSCGEFQVRYDDVVLFGDACLISTHVVVHREEP